MRFNKQAFKGGCNNPSLNMRHQARILSECIGGRVCVNGVQGLLLDIGRNPLIFPCVWLYRQGVLAPWNRNQLSFSLSPHNFALLPSLKTGTVYVYGITCGNACGCLLLNSTRSSELNLQ